MRSTKEHGRTEGERRRDTRVKMWRKHKELHARTRERCGERIGDVGDGEEGMRARRLIR